MRTDALLRHTLPTRLLHLVDALVIGVLLVTGLALGDVIPDSASAWLGGHLVLNATHRVLGVAFVLALVVLVVTLPRRVGRWLRDVVHAGHGDARWLFAFVAFFVQPKRHAAPFHAGRFDPAQRLVFAGIALSVFLVGFSGLYLYAWTPAFPLGQVSLAYAIRIHIAAAWLLIVCIGMHVIAGSGLLWTHRGLTGAMFGRGRVSATLARNLWPGWTRAQRHKD